MPPKLLHDLTKLDLEHVEFGIDEIEKTNPQRYEFRQLDGIYTLDLDEQYIVGFRNIRSDEFWVRGHIPGNPIFPGVLMLEAAAQLSSFFCTKYFQEDRFIGFGGVDKVRFRGTVRPGDHLVLLGRARRMTPRVSNFATQGVVDGSIVFEAEIIGVVIQ